MSGMNVGIIVSLLLSADAVTVQTKTRVYAHEGVPSVTVIVRQKIDGATLRLKREDTQEFSFEVPKKLGQYTFKLSQPPGTALDYEGELEVRFPKGETGAIPLNFKGEVIVPIDVQTQATLQQLAKRQFEVTANRDVARVDMTLVGEGGVPLGKHVYKPEKPSTHFTVEWPKLAVPVLSIEATFNDAQGIGRNVLLYPWYVEVPHDDVNFPTAQYEIPKTEEPKMVAAYNKVVDAAGRVAKHAPVKLYVIGHTDTVGPADKNLALSQRRAQSLAVYFRKHGFSLPVLFTGLGESALLVATPDETDNAQNRRAQYVLAIDPPLKATWSKL